MSSNFRFLLAAANIIFTKKVEGEEAGLSSVPVNVLIRTNNAKTTLAVLGNMQMRAQAQFAANMGEDLMKDVRIIDVVIINITDLGYMSEEEFKQEPAIVAGSTQERQNSDEPEQAPADAVATLPLG